MEETEAEAVQEPQPFLPGTVLESRYRIDSEVGRGGMGVVYRGTDLTLKRPVAIKALRGNDADPTVLGRFMREARSLARVEHPGLVPVYAVGREDGVYYMVMKFVEGRSLSAVLKQEGRLPADRVRRLVSEVCDALGALHREGLIHRDIKPGNLMVGSDGRITVMDLGIVKAVGENTQTTSTALGTPRYMPPEMLSHAEVDGRADLYSLGIIAWQALVGETPFDGPTPMAILYKQAHEAPEPLRKAAPDVPRNLAAAVERALAKSPDDRFADAAAFAEAVRADVVAPAEGRKATWVVAVLVALAALAYLAVRGDDPPPPPPDGRAVTVADAATTAKAAVPDAASKPQADATPKPEPDAAPKREPDAAPKPRPEVHYVQLRILSDPSGAQVKERGRVLGRTPLNLRRRAGKGALRLTLERQGYSPAKLRVPLDKSGIAKAKLEAIFELVP